MIRLARAREDFELCAAIKNEVDPDDPVTAGQISGADGVLLLHGAGGYVYVAPSSIARGAYTMVRVRPEARRSGVGAALLAAASEHARSLGRETMWGRVAEDDEGSLSFARHRSFEEVGRDVTVLLEVAPGDGELAPGIVELEEEHLRGAHAVAVECVPEIALPQVAEARPFDEWLEAETRTSPVCFVALDHDRVLGYARLEVLPAQPHRLENGLTAVLLSRRRRGIATALKRAQIKWGADNGYREIVTSMVEGNEGMRAVNERLGYRPLPASIVVSGPLV